MNIVQLHERVRFWVDVVASTRFEPLDINNAINAAIELKYLETYEQSLPMNRSDSFQRTQKAREILAPFIEKATVNTIGFSLSNNVINISNSSSYNILLSLKVQIQGSYYDCEPITYDRLNRIERNPFRKVRLSPSAKIYYIEKKGGIEIISPDDVSNFELNYLSKIVPVKYGNEYDSTHQFNIGDRIIALTDTVYFNTNYVVGDEITIVAGFRSIISGLVTFGYINCSLPEFTHEEIARRAAINCLMTAGQADKARLLREEITAL